MSTEEATAAIESVDDLFGDETTAPESKWFKFDNVGDGIGGMLVDKFEKEGVESFPSQMIYIIRTKEGEEFNVPMSLTKSRERINRALKFAQPGDLVAFKFTEVYKTKPGMADGKNIEVRHRSVPANHELAF